MTTPRRTAVLSALIASVIAVNLVPIAPVRAQRQPPDRRFGAIESFRDPVSAAEVGVGWERILLYWSQLQPNGPDDWNPYHLPDDWLNLAGGAGREVVGLLIDTPAWATDEISGCGVPRGLYLPVDDPGNLWANFVRTVVDRYRGRINRWIIWNEPDIKMGDFGVQWCGSLEDYYQLLKVAYIAAHEVNPDVAIHLAGMTTFHDPTYLRRLLVHATQDPDGSAYGYYFDAVSLHIYFRVDNIIEIVRSTRSTLGSFGLSKPIWINETNAPSNNDPPFFVLPGANFDITLEEQASFLLQAFALALTQGVDRIAAYKWVDNQPRDGEEQFGIIRTDYSRRPAFDAYRLIVDYYSGATAARADRRELYELVTLSRGARTTRVAWTRTRQSVSVTAPALAQQAILIDQTGAQHPLQAIDGQYTIDLPGARCADKRGCIIGGPTFLLVEEASGDPGGSEPIGDATESTGTPGPGELVETALISDTLSITMTLEATAPVSPIETPTLKPTTTPSTTPTGTPSPSRTPTQRPSETPTATASPPPATAAHPTATPAPTPGANETLPQIPWLPVAGLAIAAVAALTAGILFRRPTE
ncbi:MAG: hypothetical protein GX620_00870 [Chloroflexi bacterium]|nr:hypothetical protein [Chloroflexota bacterium]